MSRKAPQVMKNCKRALLIAFLAMQGCTSVHIYEQAGGVRTEQGFGVLNISFPEEQSGSITETEGLGITRIGNSMTIGYLKQKTALLDESCRVVFWIENEAQSQEIVELLDRVEGGCIVNNMRRRGKDE
ncbi:MAG: hypothetical protein L3J26_10945 [Candidatus Polarisedimenticolaceae bacterium]|nr:hypothetical protein [Candidatus Polarisedimenticolaceae bacterium]